MRLVEEVHKEVVKLVKGGDLVIDATVGNGHDTLFLAECGAVVIGFDIQDMAIENTKNRLLVGGCLERVTLYKRGHEEMAESIPGDWIGNVRMVMFNLGYLPGGDKKVITRPEITLKALEAAYGVMAGGGYLSMVVYPDHEGGGDEACAVRNWVVGKGGRVKHIGSLGVRGPEWFLVQKVNR